MSLNRKKLYSILLISCAAGYIWLIYGVTSDLSGTGKTSDVCLFKHVTDIPCPSCGSTRSVIALLHADFFQAVYINPLGIVVAMIMLIAPVWTVVDLITKKGTLFNFYCKLETIIRRPAIAIPLIALVLLNWIWNSSKGV